MATLIGEIHYDRELINSNNFIKYFFLLVVSEKKKKKIYQSLKQL